MADFAFTEILPLGDDSTPYTKLTGDHVSTFTAGGRTFLEVAPAALTLLTSTAMRDIATCSARATWRSCGRSSTIPRRRRTTASSRSTC
jgi:hypothetical protein